MSPELVQTNLSLSASMRERLERVGHENGWSLTETVRRGVRAIDALTQLHQAEANEIGGERGRIYMRIVRELGVEAVTQKEVRTGREVNGYPAVEIDDYLFFEDGEERLVGVRYVSDHMEVYTVQNGGLISLAVYPVAPNPN